jgi:Ca2+-binding EF-hand superfamily protein
MFNSKSSVKTAALVLGFIAVLPAMSSIAAPGADRFPIDLEKIEARSAAHFRAIDADSNGEVDLSEFEAAPAPKRHRQARDGKPHMQGHRGQPRQQGHHGTRAGEMGEMRETMQAELFVLLDKDSDGQLSTAEFASGDRKTRQLARKRAMFKQLDANQDGVLNPDEMPVRGKRLSRADANDDGKVTREELRSMRSKKTG